MILRNRTHYIVGRMECEYSCLPITISYNGRALCFKRLPDCPGSSLQPGNFIADGRNQIRKLFKNTRGVPESS